MELAKWDMCFSLGIHNTRSGRQPSCRSFAPGSIGEELGSVTCSEAPATETGLQIAWLGSGDEKIGADPTRVAGNPQEGTTADLSAVLASRNFTLFLT